VYGLTIVLEDAMSIIGCYYLLSVWCGLNPLKGVQGRESIAQCHC
jgi:hypothetical protein